MKKTVLLTVAMLCVAALFAQNQFITTDAGEQIPWQKPVEIPQYNEAKGANSLSTIFAGGNSYYGNMFDLEIRNPQSVTITSLDLKIESGDIADVSVYYKTGSYVGSETNPGAWTLAGTVPGVVSLGENIPTPVDIPDFTLLSGQSYGIYVVLSGGDMKYTNDPGQGTGTHTQFSNDDLILTAGNGTGFFDGINDYRIWNGTIHYSGDAVVLPLSSWMIALGLGIVGMVAFAILRRRKA